MSGLCGWISQDKLDQACKRDLESMLRTITHRGMTRMGLFHCDHFAMGVNGTSDAKVDLRRFPITSRDKRFVIALDGNIFNKQQLLIALKKKGGDIKRINSEEILMELYRFFGVQGLSKVNGHFALVLWDNQAQTCILARDCFGSKPLFYKRKKNKLTFASEAKAILALQSESVKIDHRALHEFLNFQFIPGPKSLFEGVVQVEPGSAMICTPNKIVTQSLDWSKSGTNLNLEQSLTLSLNRKLDRLRPAMFALDGTPESQLVAELSRHTSGNHQYFQFEGDYFFDLNEKMDINTLEIARRAYLDCSKKTFFPTLDVHLFEKMVLSLELPMPSAILPFLRFSAFNKDRSLILSAAGFSSLFLTENSFSRWHLANAVAHLCPQSLIEGVRASVNNRSGRVFSSLRSRMGNNPFFQNIVDFKNPMVFFAKLQGVWDATGQCSYIYGPEMLNQVELPIALDLFGELCGDHSSSDNPMAAGLRAYAQQFKLKYHDTWVADRTIAGAGFEGRFVFLDRNIWLGLSKMRTNQLPLFREKSSFYRRTFGALLSKTLLKRLPVKDSQMNFSNAMILDWLDLIAEVYLDRYLVIKHGLFNPDFIQKRLALARNERTTQTHQLLFMMAGVHALLEHQGFG